MIISISTLCAVLSSGLSSLYFKNLELSFMDFTCWDSWFVCRIYNKKIGQKKNDVVGYCIKWIFYIFNKVCTIIRNNAKKKLYPNIKSSLQYIPLVVLTPIIFNGLSIYENNIIFISENLKLYSAIIAIFVAIVFNNVLITITVGMLSFLLMSNFLNI